MLIQQLRHACIHWCSPNNEMDSISLTACPALCSYRLDSTCFRHLCCHLWRSGTCCSHIHFRQQIFFQRSFHSLSFHTQSSGLNTGQNFYNGFCSLPISSETRSPATPKFRTMKTMSLLGSQRPRLQEVDLTILMLSNLHCFLANSFPNLVEITYFTLPPATRTAVAEVLSDFRSVWC